MIVRRNNASRRSAATTVEFAFVAIPLFMILFGIFEYGRYVFTLQVMENAVREGARYAVVNTANPEVGAETIARVRNYLNGLDTAAFGTPGTITVFAADSSGAETGGPRDAAFGSYIGVRIQGTYRSILPNLLFMPSELPMDIRAYMNSEAN